MNALAVLVTAAPSVVALTKTAVPVALAVAARAHSVPLEAYLLGLATLMLPVGLVLRKREVREEKQYQERMSRYLVLEQVADRLKKPKELLAAKAVVGCILAAETGHACLDDDFPTPTFLSSKSYGSTGGRIRRARSAWKSTISPSSPSWPRSFTRT